MAARPPRAERRRRPRGGTLERPVNARMYRGTWLLVGIPLLVASLGIATSTPVPPPSLPPSFDGENAATLARRLATEHPDRTPGTPGAERAAAWVAAELRALGLRPERRAFTAEIPGRGNVRLVNVVAQVPGRSPDAVVVMAHRDTAGVGPGANDNASGTAALIEIAGSYAFVTTGATSPTGATIEAPAHTLVFVSTDGGAHGGLGAAHFASRTAYRDRIAAVVVLDALAGDGRPRLQLAGERPRTPPARLVESAAIRVLEETGRRPTYASVLDQLSDLAAPLSFYEQAPLVGTGIPALTLTTGDDAATPDFADTPDRLRAAPLGELGRAAQSLLAGLEQGVEFERSTAPSLYLGSGRSLGGWAVELVLVAALLPFFAAVVDLFARCRRRRIRLAPALLSYGRRLAFWLVVGATFAVFGAAGAWPSGEPHPPSPAGEAVDDWPLAALAGLAVVAGAAWLVAREKLLPRGPVRDEDELGGYTAALLVLGVLALVVVALNPFALLLLLPSLHAWLWLPQVRLRTAWLRAGVLVAGFAGPAFLLASLAGRFGLGADAPWYLLTLVAIGYIGPAAIVAALAWAAAAAQLTAAVSHRYAPAPSRGERTRRVGAARRLVRAVASSRRRRHDHEDDLAAEG